MGNWPCKKMNKKQLPQFKKDIKTFLTSEDGKITKKDIAKIAMGILVVGLSVKGLAHPTDHADASCAHGSTPVAY